MQSDIKPDVRKTCLVKVVDNETGVETDAVDAMSITVTGDEVMLVNAPEGTFLGVWRLDGTAVYAGTETRLRLVPGVYVAAAGSLRIKFRID